MITLSLIPLMACTDGEIDTGDVTYHQDVAPILAESCVGCHGPGGMRADRPFDSYETTGPVSGLLASVVAGELTGVVMPPFYAGETDTCTPEQPWLHDPRLSSSAIATLQAWDDAGAPEGDPATAAPLPEPQDLHLDGADDPILPDPYQTTAAGELADEFICFVADPGLTETRWLQGVEVVADDVSVVHHVIVNTSTSESALLTAMESAPRSGADWYECFGGTGVPGDFVGGWVPGSAPLEVPEGAGIRVDAGTKLVYQIHYHLDQGQTDQTGLALEWTDGEPDRESFMTLIGNFKTEAEGLQPGPNDDGAAEFRIPAGAKGHTETMVYEIPGSGEYYIWAVANHMHYVGVDAQITLHRKSPAPDEGAQACLLQTPFWDFEWQQFYFYDAASGAAPILRGGDQLEITCTYDNTLDNPGVQRALAEFELEEPVDVGLGEGSLDEMCTSLVAVVPVD